LRGICADPWWGSLALTATLRKPKTENRKPKTENRKPKTENRKPETGNRKPDTAIA